MAASATEAVRRNSGGINLAMSMGVNIGATYGYTRPNNRQQNPSNHTPRAQAGSNSNNGPGDGGTERAISNAIVTAQQQQREINV